MPVSFSPGCGAMTTSSSSPPSSPRRDGSSKRELPPLFWYMESGEWDRAVEQVRQHPRELKLWATLRTKGPGASPPSAEDAGGGGGGVTSPPGAGRSTTKRLALHHACFKLRSAGAVPPPAPSAAPAAASARGGGGGASAAAEDPYVAICRLILLLVRLYPEAASQRETRHGCLPLHLASFATCAPRTSGAAASPGAAVSPSPTFSTASSTTAASSTYEPPTPKKSGSGGIFPSRGGGGGASSGGSGPASPAKPGAIQRRAASDSTTNTMDTAQTNLSAIHAEETYTGGMGDRKSRAGAANSNNKKVNVSVAGFASTQIHPKREEMAVQVINALLDAYPKAIRVDSEGGRLPLHTACAGRATPRVVSTLVTAYSAAARHRNKDGFLPLHLAAHWGVSHPNVAVILLKAYPDATVGRNRWERTPLEEALCMAGENGRPHQAALVRALRKHPNYWIHSPDVFAVPDDRRAGGGGGARQPVDIDESLPSNDTSTEDEERRYLQFGHEFLIDPEEIVERRQETAASRARHLPPPAYLSPSGLLSRLVSGSYSSSAAASAGVGGGAGGSPGKRSARTLAEEAELALAFSLETLIQNRRWTTVLTRLASNPLEAEKDLQVQTRGGFMSQRGFTPLHYACERQPPEDVISHLLEAHPGAAVKRCLPGGCLPLHIACTWYGSADAVSALLSADPSTAMATDELGNLPLHSACFSGADDQVVVALLRANPTSVLTRNNQGSRPVDICKRLRHENRRSVMAILNLKKEEFLAGHRRSRSSGTWSEEAAAAASSPGDPRAVDGGDRGYRNEDLHEMHGAMGVEVSYNDDENQEELLWI